MTMAQNELQFKIGWIIQSLQLVVYKLERRKLISLIFFFAEIEDV